MSESERVDAEGTEIATSSSLIPSDSSLTAGFAFVVRFRFGDSVAGTGAGVSSGRVICAPTCDVNINSARSCIAKYLHWAEQQASQSNLQSQLDHQQPSSWAALRRGCVVDDSSSSLEFFWCRAPIASKISREPKAALSIKIGTFCSE